MIHETSEDQQKLQAKEVVDDGSSPRLYVLCLAARDEADEIAGIMLAQLLATREYLVQSVSFAAAAGAVVELAERHKPDVVCISATPPAAVMHARHLCRLIRGRYPDVPVIVGLWNAQGDLSKAKARIAGGAATHVVATLAEAQELVRLLIQPPSRLSGLQVPSDGGPPVMETSRQKRRSKDIMRLAFSGRAP